SLTRVQDALRRILALKREMTREVMLTEDDVHLHAVEEGDGVAIHATLTEETIQKYGLQNACSNELQVVQKSLGEGEDALALEADAEDGSIVAAERLLKAWEDISRTHVRYVLTYNGKTNARWVMFVPTEEA
ncbi:MAG: hypothetical protein ACXQS1_02630, partial [Methermicoccaceae archaeon]